MKKSTFLLAGLLTGLVVVAPFAVDVFRPDSVTVETHSAARVAPVTSTQTSDAAVVTDHSSLGRMAARVQRRLAARGEETPPVQSIIRALKTERDLLKKEITVTMQPEDATAEPSAWTVRLSEHPDWIVLRHSWIGADAEIHAGAIAQLLEDPSVSTLPQGRVSTISAVRTDEYDVQRATADVHAMDGFVFDTQKASRAIANAFLHGETTVTITAQHQEAIVRIPTATGMQELTLLASGKSSFFHSVPNREWNVHKAFRERIDNLVVQPGESLALNDTLGTPITFQKGWKEALGLFGGGAAMTPGGGICQAATTMYRAALLAGLPIVRRKPHSMYVSYYEAGGVGVDATVFPGVQDMVFKNDTQNVIVIQAYTQGFDATVNIFGIPDGRSVDLRGPYFNTSKNRPPVMRGLAYDQIGWIRDVTTADGKVRQEPIFSTYFKGIPRSIKDKYAAAEGIALLHTSAL